MKKHTQPSTRLGNTFESFESRRLMSTSSMVAGNVLVVRGTDADKSIKPVDEAPALATFDHLSPKVQDISSPCHQTKVQWRPWRTSLSLI